MLYYMELDESKEFLEIHEVKNIHNLSIKLKSSWGIINEFLNGTSVYRPRLVCGLPEPFITHGGKHMYMISYHKEVSEMRNSRYMSKCVMDELRFKNDFGSMFVTTSKNNKRRVANG